VSHTYPVPGTEGEYPAARYPELRLRLVPNESLSISWDHLGELIQALVDVGIDHGVSIELDTSNRTRPRERRGGASPMPVVALVILEGVTGAIVGQLLEAVVAWVRKHLASDAGRDDQVLVVIYNPKGEVLRRVRVPQGEGGAPPIDESPGRRWFGLKRG
jgi:hypothetical protein